MDNENEKKFEFNEKFEIYCLNYNNNERKKSMEERFHTLDISCNFYEGIDSTKDDRTKKYNNNFSCMYGHLDMIHQFLNYSEKPYGIFCEDDILIHIQFKEYLLKTIPLFEELKLDVLLLGYLISYKVEEDNHYFFEIPTNKKISNDFPFKFFNFNNDLWGTQMYMLNRKNAQSLIDKYYYHYIEDFHVDPTMIPFSADWTITKDGNKAALYPLLVVEDGKTHYDHLGQHNLHYYSFINNYIENIHI